MRGSATQCCVRYEPQARRRRGQEVVIHHSEVEALQIGDVAGQMKRQNLAAAVGLSFLNDRRSRQSLGSMSRRVAFAHDVLVRGELLGDDGKRFKDLTVLLVECGSQTPASA